MHDEFGPPLAAAESLRAMTNLWSILAQCLRVASAGCGSLALWDGGGGDGPGGTAHMYNEVKHRTGRVTWLDMRTL